ncbi:MAG TPA: HAMP domain-containing sensor histidine kinase [Solirubrobacterales bacterium]|jgi:signal transduction histidine kinase
MSHAAGRPRLGARLRPSNWPVRWRLTVTSAGLTLLILLIFAAIIGQVATKQVRDDFDGEVQGAAQSLASEFQITPTPLGTLVRGPELDDVVLPDGASARVYDVQGNLAEESTGALTLGPPTPGLSTHEGMRVATAAIRDANTSITGYIQYGRRLAPVDNTIDRLWLIIAAGVLGATLLAAIAGLAIANRAMRPISSLTATAREIATTGDPSRHMPRPLANDEVGELASTLETMLRSLDSARAEREAVMRKQREFVADASHELRTPLTSILANLELLQASLEEHGSEGDGTVVESALRSSARMSRLVADLLLLARADAGRIGARTRCDLAEAAGNAAVEVAPTVGERELRVENDQSLPVDGNPDELHRMVLNLLDNAVRHTPPGSRIELRLRKEGGRAVVEVADDGPGIPAELQGQVFERFARGDGPADTAASAGSGLGLAIVRAVAVSHGGMAEVVKSEAGGALFRIELPLAAARPKPAQALGTV